MYTHFYNLKEKPFEITPDPRFLYLSDGHREALAHLIYAVEERRGFTVITGEVGTGKTTLIQTLLSRLNGNTRTAYIFNPNLDSNDFLHYICQDFGLRVQERSKGQYVFHLHNFLMDCYAKNENAVLIIDEAQNLDPNLLEEVRLLTNLETPKRKLLQVILMGQPELNKTLAESQFRQLRQRISLRYHMRHLDKGEMKKYIIYRLLKAGARDTRIFTPKALDRIYHYSKGIPRLINVVCDNALLSGYATDQKMIGDRIIREVTDNLEGPNIPKNKLFKLLAISFILIACMLGAFTAWRYGFFQSVVLSGLVWMEGMRGLLQRVWSTFF